MNTKTPIKERAAAPTTAPTIEQQRTAYREADALSSMKLQIGELLLFGNRERGELWSLFEVLLIQYIDVGISQDAPQGRSGYVERTNDR